MATLENEFELLAAVFESSLDAKVIIDDKGTVYRANRAAERIFGKSLDEDLSGKNLQKLVSNSSREGITKLIANIKENGEVHEEIAIKMQKTTRIFDVTANADIVDNLHLLIMRDVTQKVHFQETRNQFIAIANHELKTPLAVISAYTDLLKRKLSEDFAAQAYLNKIAEKNRILNGYIESIMDEIKIGVGKFVYEDEVYTVDSLVKSYASELRKMYPENSITIKGSSESSVLVDKERLSQVIRNLVINAIKHSKKNKEITILVEDRDNSVYFSVSDKGKGIPVSEQHKIFNAFYRRDKTGRSREAGLGLGLYIAKQIVEHYRGELSIKSRPRKGSTFYFELRKLEEKT